jgi:hypothetical protein
MELKDFVSTTIKQILDGVIAAQEYGSGKSARVNPRNLPVRNNEGEITSTIYRSDVEHNIEFDVVVTTTEGSQTKSGLGVFVGSVGLGAQGQSSVDNQSVSRIKFSIPVVFPSEK